MIFSILTAIPQPRLFCSSVARLRHTGGESVAVSARRVPQGVPDAVDTFLAQHLKEAGYARLLYLFEHS